MKEVTFALRRQRRSLAIWSGSLGAYMMMMILIWPSMRGSVKVIQDYINSMPEGFTKAFGITDMSTPAGYLGAELFSVVLPMLLIVAAIMATIALTAGYEDAGYFETVLALPVRRRDVFARRGIAAMVWLAGLSLVVYAVLVLGAAVTSMHLAQDRVAAAVLCVFALAAFHASIGYLAAGLGFGRGRALGTAAGIAVLGYAMNSLFPLTKSLEPFAAYSPWHWTVDRTPLLSGLPVAGVLLTLGITAAAMIAGTVAVRRRDIRLP